MAFNRKKGPAPLKTPVLAQPVPPLAPGDRVGNFEIVSKLGEGGMGVVYKARRTFTGEPAVIKVLHPWLASNQDAAQRFLNEARASSAIKHRHRGIKHRNIVTVFDVGQRAEGQYYIAMEFLEGNSLAFKLHSLDGPLGVEDIVLIISQVANALHDAHEQGVVHRDIKPENIFVTGDHVTILDFGIAKLDESHGGGHTAAGAVLGTPLYMAPEQLRGEEIDRRADVYAVAAVTWEMAVGEPLWGDGTEPPGAIQERQRLTARPLDPCVLKPHIPSAFGGVVARGLAFDRDHRYPTVQAFALALGSAITTTYGESGMAIVRDVADELTILDGATDTAGRPLPSPRSAAVTVRAVQPAQASTIPVAPLTPPPGQIGRADLPTAASSPPPPVSAPAIAYASQHHPTTLGGAAGATHGSPALVEPRRKPRRALLAVAVATGLVVAIVAVVAAASGGNEDAPRAAAPAPPAVTSALAIITEPSGASIYVDGTARGVAPLNLAATVGADIEISAELAGHTAIRERVRVGAVPATVRLTLGAIVDAGTPDIDAGLHAGTIDAGPRAKRDQSRSGQSGATFDPDGVIGP